MIKRMAVAASVFLVLITLSSCVLFQSEVDNVIDLLPRDSDVPGWEKVNSSKYYKGKDIKNYNEQYRHLGMEKVAYAVFRSIDDRDLKIKLEVIKFGSVYDAYGFFSILKGAGVYEAAQINEDYTNASAVIRIGEYIIYAVTEQSDLLMRKDLKTFVNVPLMYIGRNYSENNLPESLNILKGKDGYGVMYSRRPHYKFPLLSGINITQWAWNTDVINVYCAETKSFYDSYSIFKKSTENGYIVVSSDNIYTAFKTEEDGKYIFISVSDKWIYGCWALKDFNDGKKVLNEIRLRIEDYKKKGKK